MAKHIRLEYMESRLREPAPGHSWRRQTTRIDVASNIFRLLHFFLCLFSQVNFWLQRSQLRRSVMCGSVVLLSDYARVWEEKNICITLYIMKYDHCYMKTRTKDINTHSNYNIALSDVVRPWSRSAGWSVGRSTAVCLNPWSVGRSIDGSLSQHLVGWSVDRRRCMTALVE